MLPDQLLNRQLLLRSLLATNFLVVGELFGEQSTRRDDSVLRGDSVLVGMMAEADCTPKVLLQAFHRAGRALAKRARVVLLARAYLARVMIHTWVNCNVLNFVIVGHARVVVMTKLLLLDEPRLLLSLVEIVRVASGRVRQQCGDAVVHFVVVRNLKVQWRCPSVESRI